MTREPDPTPIFTPSVANRAGLALHNGLDLGRPVGAWTGLSPSVGAPLSGALWGAGAGLTYGMLRKLFSSEEENENRSMWAPILLGALGGGGLGAWSGHLQNQTRRNLATTPAPAKTLSYNEGAMRKFSNWGGGGMERAVYLLRSDSSMSDHEKSRLLYALQIAPPQQQSRILQLAAVGGLTALAASKVLGLGLLSSALVGGAAAYTFNNYTRKPINL